MDVMMSLGKGAVVSQSTKQKLNARSSSDKSGSMDLLFY
jgi:hypothetical protein